MVRSFERSKSVRFERRRRRARVRIAASPGSAILRRGRRPRGTHKVRDAPQSRRPRRNRASPQSSTICGTFARVVRRGLVSGNTPSRHNLRSVRLEGSPSEAGDACVDLIGARPTHTPCQSRCGRATNELSKQIPHAPVGVSQAVPTAPARRNTAPMTALRPGERSRGR
jgi:hypothetical protein